MRNFYNSKSSSYLIKWGLWVALMFLIGGVCLAFLGKSIGVGFVIGAIISAVISILRTLKLIHDKIKQAEEKIKKLEKEIEFLKNK